MAYGLAPQLYPYLYAPKNQLTLSSSPFIQESSHEASRQKSIHNKDDCDEKHNDSLSVKEDDDTAAEESENVEID